MSPVQERAKKLQRHEESATGPKTNESADASTPSARQQRVEERRKGMKGQAAAAKTSTNPAAARGWRRCSFVRCG